MDGSTNSMLITYVVTVATGLYAVGSIVYFLKNKRFIGRSMFSTIAAVIVFFMGIYASVKGIPITQLQYLIESALR